ncbi:retrotransposon protein, putative, ty3-gypsy subclass [Tanacetum coccineum]
MVKLVLDDDSLRPLRHQPWMLVLLIREKGREEYRTGAVTSGSNPPPVTIHTWLERFNKQKPRSFEKAVCHTRLAVYKFEGDALAWWKAYKQAKGGDAWVLTLTWAAFKCCSFSVFLERARALKRDQHSIRQRASKIEFWCGRDQRIELCLSLKAPLSLGTIEFKELNISSGVVGARFIRPSVIANGVHQFVYQERGLCRVKRSREHFKTALAKHVMKELLWIGEGSGYQKWPRPEVWDRSAEFLGLAGYYRSFVREGLSRLAFPLIAYAKRWIFRFTVMLLKKGLGCVPEAMGIVIADASRSTKRPMRFVKMYHDLKHTLWCVILVWKWDEISMDFVTGLPRTQRKHDAIWVVVDRLTKSAHFLPIRKDYPVSKLAEMFQHRIVRYRTPSAIVSDRRSHVSTSRFLEGFSKESLGNRLKEKLKEAQDSSEELDAQTSHERLSSSRVNMFFLNVSPTRGVRRFCFKGKLGLMFHRDRLEILERVVRFPIVGLPPQAILCSQ